MALDNFRTIELIWDKASKSIIKSIKTASNDTTGRYLSVKILDGGQEVTLSNARLQLYWEHPSFNTSGTDDFNIVNNGGLFNMTFSEEMLTNVGELNAHLILTLADGKITSDGFPIKVFKGADDGVVVPTNGKGLVKQIDGKIDKGNVTLSDLTQEVKLALTGGAVAVVGENTVGTENIKATAVTPEKTNFINTSTNMIDTNSLTELSAINTTNGTIVADTQSAVSDFYSVSAGEKFSHVGIYRVGFYDSNKAFISTKVYENLTTTQVTTIPTNCHFVRLQIPMNKYDVVQMNRGGALLPYEQYYKPKLSSNIELLLPPPEITTKGNVFNGVYDTGKIISSNAGTNTIYGHSTGISAFVEISNLTYKLKVTGTFDRFFVAFTNGKNVGDAIFRLHGDMTPNSIETFTVNNVDGYKYLIVYVSATGQKPDLTVFQGDTIPENLPLLFYKGSELAKSSDLPDLSAIEAKRYSRLYVVNDDEDVFVNEPPSNKGMYALYDELGTKSNGYATKELLGTTNDGLSNEIWQYKFSKPNVENYLGMTRPKIGITTGVHGNEKAPAMGLYHFMKSLVLNPEKNEIIDLIKSRVDFYIIPVTNPTGWDNHTRVNGNGVNLNRNFETYWELISDADKGSAPASEIETQSVQNWMTVNMFDYYLDLHTYQQAAGSDQLFTIQCNDQDEIDTELRKPFVRTVETVSEIWSDKYSFYPRNTMFGRANNYPTLGPMTYRHGNAVGITSALIEYSDYVNYDGTNNMMLGRAMCAEAIGNYLFQLCKKYFD